MAGVIAENYSDALYTLAMEEQQIDLYREQLTLVCESLCENKDFYTILQNPKLGKEEKKELLHKVYASSISQFLLNFLQLLIDKGRFSYIFDIKKQYVQRYYEEHNIVVAYVESAKSLSEDEKQRLHGALEKKLQKQIELVVDVKEHLMAGVRIKVNDQVFDNTAKTRLKQLKKQVVKSATMDETR